MIDRGPFVIAVAVVALVVPLAFVALVVVAAVRRRDGRRLGPAFERVLAGAGGLALGSMFLVVAGDLVVAWPLIAVPAIVFVADLRRGRGDRAGLLLAGFAVPWTVLWASHTILLATGVADYAAAPTVAAFLGGLAVVVSGAWLAWRGARRQPSVQDANHPADGQKRTVARSFQTLPRALQEPNLVGPFSLQAIASTVALAAAFVIVPLAAAILGVPALVSVGLTAVVAALAATEAHLRSMSRRSTRAMEAFVWLGHRELSQLRSVTGEGMPLRRPAAESWLRRHPAAPNEDPVVTSARGQLLLMVGRPGEARAIADAMPIATAEERVARAATQDLVDWWSGGAGRVEDLERAARDLSPSDGDAGLEAMVSVAIARTRQAIVAPGLTSDSDPLAALLEARARLGDLAKGEVRRRLWPRLFGTFLVGTLVLQMLWAIVDATTRGVPLLS